MTMLDTMPLHRDPHSLVREGTTAFQRTVLSRINNGIELARRFRTYRKAYSNYIRLIGRFLVGNPFPVIAITRSGARVVLRERAGVVLYSASGKPACPVRDVTVSDNGVVTFQYQSGQSTIEIRLSGLLTNGDPGVFVNDEYGFLPVKDRVVVDVGASIGDSPLYFIAKGARRVYAYEPFPRTYQLAVENARQNGVEDRIHLERAAIGNWNGHVKLNEPIPTAFSKSVNAANGVSTDVVSLSEIVHKWSIRDGILKMDCEGAEYDAILDSSNEVLRSFSHIQVEYHYGYKLLESKLEQAGFIVSHKGPERYLPTNGDPVMYFGFVYAVRG